MSDELREQLSALVDDELQHGEARLLARRLAHEQPAVQQLRRYFLIRDTLQGNVLRTDVDLSARVAVALAEEPAHSARRTRVQHLGRAARPVAGMGIAASVALAVVMLWPQPGVQEPGGDDVAGAPSLEQVAGGSLEAGPPAGEGGSGLSPVSSGSGAETGLVRGEDEPQPRQQLDPQLQQRLNFYLVNHSEYSSTGSLGSVLKYARIAGHDREQE